MIESESLHIRAVTLGVSLRDTAAKTLEVAQELYDGAGKKVITYPRAETRYLPESLIGDAPRIVSALQAGQSFAAIPVPQPPLIRRGTGLDFLLDGTVQRAGETIRVSLRLLDLRAGNQIVWVQRFDRQDASARSRRARRAPSPRPVAVRATQVGGQRALCLNAS